MNFLSNFRGLILKVDMVPSCLKHMYSSLFAFIWKSMAAAACSQLCCMDSAWAVDLQEFARSST